MTPTKIGTESDYWIDYSLGANTLVVIKGDGQIYGAGSNINGAIGYQRTSNAQPTLLPVSNSNNDNFIDVSIGGDSLTIGLKADGTTWAIGENSWGQMGNGYKYYYEPLRQMGAATDWTSISSGALSSMRINQAGELYSVGATSYSNLGRGGNSLIPGIVDIP